MKRNLLLVLLISGLITGCGSAPTVRSYMLPGGGYTEKLKNLQFIYRESKLKSKVNYSRHYSFDGDMNGYNEFGDILVETAPSEFKKYGVTIGESFKIDSKEKFDLSKNTLLIYSSGGRIKQDRAATTVSFKFNAKYISSAKKKVIWNGLIETNTWSGRNFISENLPQTLYDKKYAKEILSMIAEKMKKDGLIN